MQFQLGTSFLNLGGIGGGMGIPLVNAGFVGGFKIDRLLVGLRMDVMYAGSEVKEEADGDEGINRDSYALLLFAPTVQFHIVERGALAVYLTGSLDIGPIFQREKVIVNGDVQREDGDNLLAVGFTAGLGFRYFFVPRVGLSVEVGIRGMWNIDVDERDLGPVTRTTTTTDGGLSLHGVMGVIIVL